MKIWTVGTSSRSMKEFLHVLRAYQIGVVVDVRRFPTSRYRQFTRERLKYCLEQHGIEYHHVGRLGGFRKGGYRAYMDTPEFERGLAYVIELAASKRVALMCAELLFFRCHRRFIADALKDQGHTVVHIVDDKKSYEHSGGKGKDVDRKLTEFLGEDEVD